MTGIAGDGTLSRINLDMSGSNPNVIFASVVDSTLDLGGIYKSTNGGNTWNAISTTSLPFEPLGGLWLVLWPCKSRSNGR